MSAIDIFNFANVETIAKEKAKPTSSFSLSHLGNPIVSTPRGLSTRKGRLPASMNNFLKITADGSARMKILLINDDQNDSVVNRMLPTAILRSFGAKTVITDDRIPKMGSIRLTNARSSLIARHMPLNSSL